MIVSSRATKYGQEKAATSKSNPCDCEKTCGCFGPCLRISWRRSCTAATGTWTYRASFRTGPDVALTLEPEAGTPAAFDGATGTFDIADADDQALGTTLVVGNQRADRVFDDTGGEAQPQPGFAESAVAGQSIIAYDPSGPGAEAYRQIAKTILENSNYG